MTFPAFRWTSSSAARVSSSPATKFAPDSSPISKSSVSVRARAPAARSDASPASRRSAVTFRYPFRISEASAPVPAKSSIADSAAGRDSSIDTLC
jgi:hypothetical protein